MDERFKVLAFDAIAFARRIREQDVPAFLSFVEKNCSSEELATIRALVNSVSDGRSVKRATEPSGIFGTDVYEREIRAILSDVSFLPGKRDLLLLLRTIFGNIPEGLSKKGSRDALVDWAIRQITHASSAERVAKYRALRQLFLRKRDSSLQDWAEIITKPSS